MTESDENQIRNVVLGVLGSIFLLLILFCNSDFYIKDQYYQFRKESFRESIIIKELEHGESSPHAGRIYSNKGRKIMIDRCIYDKLEIGDSIIKDCDCDSIFYYTKNGLIIDDENSFRRNKYHKSIED